MSKYINVSAVELTDRRTSHSSVVAFTASKTNGAYFGLLQRNKFLALRFENLTTGYRKYFHHWGFPIKSQWRREWGAPAYHLYSGDEYDVGVGWLTGYMGNTFYREIPVEINRGNSRQGSVDVRVGVEAGSLISADFSANNFKTITLKTLEIPKVSNVAFSCIVDPNTIQKRYIKLHVAMTNHENFYTAKIYNEKEELKFETQDNSSDTYIEIPENTDDKVEVFTLKIIGKDDVLYETKTVRAYVEASGVGVTIKESNTPKEVSAMSFKNVSVKSIPEVWVKVDGKVYKTVK